MYGKNASPIEHLGWLFHVFLLHLRLVIVMCLTPFLFLWRGTSYTTAPIFVFFVLFCCCCCSHFFVGKKDKIYGKKTEGFLGPKVIIEIMGHKLAGLNEDDMARYLRPCYPCSEPTEMAGLSKGLWWAPTMIL